MHAKCVYLHDVNSCNVCECPMFFGQSLIRSCFAETTKSLPFLSQHLAEGNFSGSHHRHSRLTYKKPNHTAHLFPSLVSGIEIETPTVFRFDIRMCRLRSSGNSGGAGYWNLPAEPLGSPECARSSGGPKRRPVGARDTL